MGHAMYWLYLRLMVVPYLAIRAIRYVSEGPLASYERKRAHELISMCLAHDIIRMHKEFKPYHQWLENLAWLIFLMVQLATILLSLLGYNTPELTYDMLSSIQGMSIGVLVLIMFPYLGLLAQSRPEVHYERRSIGSYLVNSLHRDFCFISIVAMVAIILPGSGDHPLIPLIIVIGFFVAINTVIPLTNTFQLMMERFISDGQINVLKRNNLKGLSTAQKKQLLMAEIEGEEISLSKLFGSPVS